MPLLEGAAKQTISKNLRRLREEGVSRKQSLAIVLTKARKAQNKAKSNPRRKKGLIIALRVKGD